MPAKKSASRKSTAKEPTLPKTPRNGPLEMVSPNSFQQSEDQTNPHINPNMTLQRPISVGLEQPRLPSNLTYFDDDSHLRHARQMFQISRAGIMGPPPRPNPNQPAQSGALLNAFTERTVYTQLLEGHQEEILRLEGELKAEKVKSAGLETKLEKAEEALVAAQKVAGPGVKKRKVNGRRSC